MIHRTSILLGLVLVLLVLGAALLALPTYATPAAPTSGSQRYVATTGTDTGNDCLTQATPCATIGYAISQSVSGSVSISDTINIAAGIYHENIVINKYIILQGAGASSTVVDGSSTGRVIAAEAPRLSINNLTIQNGNAGGLSLGGGIFISGTGQVNIRNSFIISNTATQGGGVYASNGASIFLTRSAIYSNTASSTGGAIVIDLGSTATITQSAVVSNTATSNGGGIYNNGTFTGTNSTIGGNGAASGAGIYNNAGVLGLYNVTVSSNTASSGGGGIASTGGAVKLANTLLATNSQDCSGSIGSLGYNMVGNNAGCTFTPTTGDHLGTPGVPINPNLGPMGLNFGFTLNQALLAGSPAIDQGNVGGCRDYLGNLLTVDQRGTSRPQGLDCDIGAYEFGEAPTIVSLNPNSIAAGSPAFTLAVNGGNFENLKTTVLWNGNPISPTNYISPTQVTVTVPAALVASPGVAEVSVQKTGPNGGTTGALQFMILGPHGVQFEVYLPLIMR